MGYIVLSIDLLCFMAEFASLPFWETNHNGEQNHSHNAMLDSPKAWPAPVPIPPNLPKTSDLTVSKPVWATHLACWMTFKTKYMFWWMDINGLQGNHDAWYDW